MISQPTQKIIYDYFGNSREHAIVLEKILPREAKAKYPLCIAGKRNCPTEDCGGVYGYAELLKTISDPKNEEYEEMMDWLGSEFDPEEFNMDGTNAMLKRKGYGCFSIDG